MKKKEKDEEGKPDGELAPRLTLTRTGVLQEIPCFPDAGFRGSPLC
jgi:hypothetical protein